MLSDVYSSGGASMWCGCVLDASAGRDSLWFGHGGYDWLWFRHAKMPFMHGKKTEKHSKNWNWKPWTETESNRRQKSVVVYANTSAPHHNSRPINTAIIMVQKNVPKQNKELLFQWIQPTYTRWSSRPECWPRVQDLFACWNNWPHPKCFFVRETWYCFWRKQPNKIAS